MKTYQKLILFAVGLFLLTSNAQAGRWLTRDPMDIPAHMELDPHPFFDGNPYTFVGNNPVNNVDPYGLWIWFGWFRSQPSQPAPYDPNSYKAMRDSMIGDPSDYDFNGKNAGQVTQDIAMAIPKGILNTAGMMLGPGEAEGAYAAADEALQASRAAKLAKAASKCDKMPAFKEVEAALDATGKVHGTLPNPTDLSRYHPEDLQSLLNDLQQSVQKRIENTSNLGSDVGHNARQAQEQQLIQAIQKYLGNQ